jgi:magnesium chelatase family protein
VARVICHIAKPREPRLAYHGVLFLDELPKFKREVLRQPLADGVITVAHTASAYPIRLILVWALSHHLWGGLRRAASH